MFQLTPVTSFVLVPPFVVLHMIFRYYFQKFVMNKFKDNKNVKKLSECMFYFVQYLVFTIISSVIVIKNKIWWFNYENLYSEMLTLDSFTALHGLYLMLELAVCISTAITWCFETRKEHADFAMMVVHHICTTSLICFCMYSKNFNWGASVANLHDMSDIFLEFSKMIYYLGFERVSKVTFFMFAFSFIIPRCFVFPKFMIAPFFNGKLDETMLKMNENVIMTEIFSKIERNFITSALSVLFILNCIWAAAIVNMAVKLLVNKEWRDVREKQEKSE
ncbi:Ceramide_synthetase [Hexamita inflata]|uniref:Ceramide_synthetase n=1 Tax=Hexamita inflata TaxID=28002 RepID=A0ABP1JIF2_9EUKA